MKEIMMRAKEKLLKLWQALSDWGRTGAILAASAAMLWWLRDPLAGAKDFMLMGALAATGSGVTAYWVDRCLFPDSRPHTIPWPRWKQRMFAESRRFLVFALVLLTVNLWFKG